ncbi:MAG TPA: AAA family ATPase [Pseudolabrys sp.]
MLQRISDGSTHVTYAPQIAADVGPSSGITIAGIVTILRRRLTIVAAVSAIIVALTLVFILVVRPSYTGTATVLIDPHRSDVINLNENAAAVRNSTTDEAAIQSQVLLMQSAEVLRRVVRELNLTGDPDFSPQASFLGPLKKLFSSGHKPAGLSAQDIAVLNSIDILQKRLKVTRQQNSYLVDINVRSHDPNKAAVVANAVADAYLAELVKAKSDSVKVAAGWMDEQLAQIKSRVHDADKGVEDYRAQHQLVMTQGVTVNDQQIADLNTQLIQARAEAAQAKAKYEQVAQIAKDHVDAGSLPEALTSETIARLRGQYADLTKNVADLSSHFGPRHPMLVAARAQLRDTQKLIDAEVHRILQSRHQNFDVAVAREASLEKSLNGLQDVSTDSGRAQVHLRELQREADANRTLYESFLGNYKQAAARETLKLPEARMVAKSDVPMHASFPRPLLFLALAFPLGLVLGAILAIGVDHFDRRVKSLNQLAVITGLPALASMPIVGLRELSRIAKRGREALAQHNPASAGLLPIPLQPPLMHYIAEEPNSVFAEAVRAVRLSVQRAGRIRPVQSVMVTSSIDGEGKTTLAANLALSYAMLGARTLLVEGDLRNPEMTRSLCPRAKMGILDVALGRASLRQAILTDPTISFSVLPAPVSEHSSLANEFVFSNALGVILTELRRHYDIIVIDAPPLIPLVDSAALGEYADGIVMTVGWDRTREDVIDRALGQLSSLHDRLLGTVLTRADLKRMRHYDCYYSAAYIEPYTYLKAAKQSA